MLNTNKPTEIERSVLTLNRCLDGIQITAKCSVPALLQHVSTVEGCYSTANNLRFAVAFNPMEETSSNRLSSENLMRRLDLIMANCDMLTHRLDSAIDQAVQSDVAVNAKLSALKKAMNSVQLGTAATSRWSAIEADTGYVPVLHITAHNARDGSGYVHEAYHVWMKPRGRAVEIAASFHATAPTFGWEECSTQAAVMPALKKLFKNDGF